MKKSIYSMFCCYKMNFNTTYCVLLSYYDTHLVISIQSTKQIRNRYSLENHSKPSFFLLYKPFNQSINLTKNASNPYPARFLALNLTTILSSKYTFNQIHFYRILRNIGTNPSKRSVFNVLAVPIFLR